MENERLTGFELLSSTKCATHGIESCAAYSNDAATDMMIMRMIDENNNDAYDYNDDDDDDDDNDGDDEE